MRASSAARHPCTTDAVPCPPYTCDRGPLAGWFRPGRLVAGDPETLTRWRADTRSSALAVRVALLLGGRVHTRQPAAHGCWEVATATRALPVLVERADARGLVFRLADGETLGRFGYRLAGWPLSEVLGTTAAPPAGAGASRRAVLTLAPLMVTTRTGREILYARPALTRPAGRCSSPSSSPAAYGCADAA